MDFEAYRRAAYVNEVGRLPRSTRFMAPEEYTAGAVIDAGTTVYNLGRMVEYFVEPHQVGSAVETVVARATAPDRCCRTSSVRALQSEWRQAVHELLPPCRPSGDAGRHDA